MLVTTKERFTLRKLKDPATLKMFFSSPFGGMENEREELTRKYFPRLHHACNARGIQFVPVDMRWGITSEAADNAQVINICLREIDRSDVFVGFFGQRYGWHGESDELLTRNFDNAIGRYPWLANFRDKSVTELEFLHGHLLHPGQLPATFCFRDKAYDDVMKDKAEASRDSKTAIKYIAESEHSMKLMEDLIIRVKETESQCLGVLINYKNPHEITFKDLLKSFHPTVPGKHVHDSLCVTGSYSKNKADLLDGAKFMFESVWKYCQELLAVSDSKEISLLEQGRLCHDAFVSSRISIYLGGDGYLQELEEKMDEHQNVLVHGPAGSGKSALLANLVKLYKSSEKKVDFIYHFVGCAQGTTDPKSIMQRILAELQHINGSELETENESDNKDSIIDKTNVNEFHDIYISVQNEMERASSAKKCVIIIIDSVNRVTASTKTAKHLYWLPEKFPPGISLVVSSVTSDTETFDLLVTQRKFYNLEILPLLPDVQKEICKETLLINGKELSPDQLQRVVEAKQTRNPLFLKIVISEISIYGYFRFLDKKIDSLIYSKGVKELLNKVMQRLEEDYNVSDHPDPLVQQVLSAIAVSHQGLSETELLDILQAEYHVWSPFYFTVELFLINNAGLLRFAFSEFEEAVEDRYLHSDDLRSIAINQLIEYFDKIRRENKNPNDFSGAKMKRVASELPWLQKDINDKWGLIQTLSDLRIFYSLQRKSVYELIDLWTATGCGQDEICKALLSAFDLAVGEVYNCQQESGKDNTDPPGYILLKVLRAMRDMFSIACYHRAEVQVLQRTVRILEGVQGRIDEGTRITLLKENCYHLACAYVNNSEYEKAEILHTSVMQECRSLLMHSKDSRLKQTLAFTCNGLGILHIKQKHYKEAEPLFQESIHLHKELGNTLCVAESIMNLGVITLNSGEPAMALEYFNAAMKEFETIYFGHLPVLVGNLLTNMALCHRRMGEAEKAESLYLRSMEVKANAVGWQNEVIASCYMNLGSLEFYTRKDYQKAESYTRKAIDILELNEVKLEQNEMWQAQENLILMLICQNKWEEAIPIFRFVFAMLQRENKVSQGASSVHREMIRHLISKENFEEAANIAQCHLCIPAFQQPNVYILLDYCDRKSPTRPSRPRELTINYALEELWPGNNELTDYVVQNYVLPSNDLDLFMKMLRRMDELNPKFKWTSYKVGAIWCENLNNLEAAVMVLKEGIEKYPDFPELKSRLFDCYRKLSRHKEAYPLMKEVLDAEPDNQAIILIAGQVALSCDDIDLCLELWEKVTKMPDESLAQMANTALVNLKEELAVLDKESEDDPDGRKKQS